MPFINGNVKVEELDHGRWKLLEALNYQGERDLFKVPAGFVTDFASVPGLFTWLVPRYGRFTKAAILHDFLCDEAKEGRFIHSQADGIFRRVMRELGVGFIRRWVMWAAVRLGSGWGVFQPNLWQFLLVLLIAAPTAAFVLTPTVVILVALVVFWIVELLFFLGLKPFSSKRVNEPPLVPKLS
jgi:hypothetical protein